MNYYSVIGGHREELLSKDYPVAHLLIFKRGPQWMRAQGLPRPDCKKVIYIVNVVAFDACDYFNVNHHQLFERGHHQCLVRARQWFYQSLYLCGFSVAAIGRIDGVRAGATVHNGLKMFYDRINRPSFANESAAFLKSIDSVDLDNWRGVA